VFLSLVQTVAQLGSLMYLCDPPLHRCCYLCQEVTLFPHFVFIC
jgi:hypothetical protein